MALPDNGADTEPTTLTIPLAQPDALDEAPRLEFLPPNLPPIPLTPPAPPSTEGLTSPTMSPDDILFVLEAWRLSELNPHFNIQNLPEWTLLYRLTHPTPTATPTPSPEQMAPDATAPPAEWAPGDLWPAMVVEEEAPPLMLDINDSAPEELMLLGAGLDARRAAAIVAFRETHGPFGAVDELSRVFGVTDFMVDRWRPFLYVDRRPAIRPPVDQSINAYADQFVAANALPGFADQPTTNGATTTPSATALDTMAPPPPPPPNGPGQ